MAKNPLSKESEKMLLKIAFVGFNSPWEIILKTSMFEDRSVLEKIFKIVFDRSNSPCKIILKKHFGRSHREKGILDTFKSLKILKKIFLKIHI